MFFFFFVFVVSVKIAPGNRRVVSFLVAKHHGKGPFWRRGDTHVEKESFQSCNFPIPPEIRLGSFRSSIDRWCIPTS